MLDNNYINAYWTDELSYELSSQNIWFDSKIGHVLATIYIMIMLYCQNKTQNIYPLVITRLDYFP